VSELDIPRARMPFVIAVLVAMVVGTVAVGIAFHRVAGPQSAAGVPPPLPLPTATPLVSPTPAVSASPSPTASTVPFADCTLTQFGPALAPLNPPSNVHVYSAVPPMTIDRTKLYLLTITTTRGTIDVCLQPDLAPTTVNVIVTLARNHFYDGLKFHRVVANFVIQGGDPTGSGSGGPGFTFNDEPVRNQYVLGAIAMANSGPNTNGSQFFICIADDTTKLQPLYNLFGKVRNGLDVAQRIQQGDVMTSVTVAQQQ
jgi:cyclophilin family peptidyl-prolyl cis-trans isomerase